MVKSQEICFFQSLSGIMSENLQFIQAFGLGYEGNSILNEMFDDGSSKLLEPVTSSSPPTFENPAEISLQVNRNNYF